MVGIGAQRLIASQPTLPECWEAELVEIGTGALRRSIDWGIFGSHRPRVSVDQTASHWVRLRFNDDGDANHNRGIGTEQADHPGESPLVRH